MIMVNMIERFSHKKFLLKKCFAWGILLNQNFCEVVVHWWALFQLSSARTSGTLMNCTLLISIKYVFPHILPRRLKSWNLFIQNDRNGLLRWIYVSFSPQNGHYGHSVIMERCPRIPAIQLFFFKTFYNLKS